MAFGMAPKLVPQHLQRQALARVRDLNPFQRIADEGDLRRALRLAWIEAALEVERAVADGVMHDDEWSAQANEVQRFSAVMKAALDQLRDAAFDRRQPPGASAIDAQLSQLLVEMPTGFQHEVGGAAPGDGLTRSFVAILAAETGWPAAEVPPLYPRVAEQGVLQHDGWRRPFGELVFAAFAELLKQPGRYPEAGVEFQTAMAGMAREVAVATLQGVQGLDEKLDRALTLLGKGSGFSGIGELVSSVEQQVVDMRLSMERRLDELPDQLIAALEAKGVVFTGAQAIDRQTVIALARRLRPEESLDFDQALRELEHAVELAREVLATGEHAATQDAFIDRVLQHVAKQTRDGLLEVGADELDAALAKLDGEEQARRRRQRLPLLEAAIKQAVLLRDAKRAARAVLQIGELDDPVRPAWSVAYHQRLKAFMDEGDQRGLNLSLEIAIALARELLDAATGSDERGEASNGLGIALTRLGERERGTARLEEAVQAYRAALQEYTQERVPLDWAMTQNNLGIALARLGERERGTARLEEAVQAYRAALQEYTHERVPLDWAGTQNNLGNALRALGEREDSTARLEEAVQAYRAALQERTQERVPLDWAMTQNNLGIALACLGERERGTTRLEEAVQAYRAALKELTAEATPWHFENTSDSLQRALDLIEQHRSGPS
ncbi:tetratricopeptide repeat protein [Azohydromonas aeria]|uniref:tetratricopeptide repeat protein n=1 Tax=Azohydromonas aeria TaxID=2590212 RepID=UPI0018DEFE16|nr:tetratricopeptide repeat protein [Azohydromonas aeria]